MPYKDPEKRKAYGVAYYTKNIDKWKISNQPSEKRRLWRKEYFKRQDPAQRKANKKRYYERHKAQILAQQKTSKAHKRETVKAWFKRYREDPYNKEKAKIYGKAWREKNVERRQAYVKDRKNKAMFTAIRQRRRTRLTMSGSFTTEEWQRVLQYYGEYCLCCGKNDPGVDHVIPLCKGGPNVALNLQPLCKPCNSSKRTRDFDFRPLHDLMIWWFYYARTIS